jgi:coproporphyrinogen III oxidase-like Fe-S oxidoreductase
LNSFEAKIADFEKDDLLKLTQTHCVLTRKGMAFLDSIAAMFTNQDIG